MQAPALVVAAGTVTLRAIIGEDQDVAITIPRTT